ncbi:putative Galactose-binding-like domain superfamily, YHYH domain-containing protein [Plasmopara halstedii]
MVNLLSVVFRLLTLSLAVASTLSIEPLPQAADAYTIVNADNPKNIRLDANLLIPDGGELLLSIQVPHEPIQVQPRGPAKVVRVYSDHVDDKIGEGEVINIFVKFTSAIKLMGSGSPHLLLKTGCHESACHTKEIQRLRCMATEGKFAVGFGSQKVGNIPWDASAYTFAEYLTRITSIHKVSVTYSIDEDRACTFFGNNITITFDSMNIEGADGNLVEMTGDKTNAVGDGEKLRHVMYQPLLTESAWEIQRGVHRSDRKAEFMMQTASDTLRFEYTVQRGDSTKKLEYTNVDSLTLSLRANDNTRILNDDSTNTVANTNLPPPGFAGNWERGVGTSLSKSSSLEIDVIPPFITTVTSPNEDGTFGEGDEILIHVHFSKSIAITGVPTLTLMTRVLERKIPFSQVVAGNIAEFKYIVQSTDMSPDLTYSGTTALQLNGGSIRRKSTLSVTNAVLSLPVIGEIGSLSVNKNIVVDTSNPRILSVTTTVKYGIYTAGDEIPLLITFDRPVVVTGIPQLLLDTGSIDLFPGDFVVRAPTRTSSKTVVFPSNYLFTTFEKGLQFKIDGQILTVETVNKDEVTMVEMYTATTVNSASIALGAAIPIYTPGYRPAKYLNGTGTNVLTFVYMVQIGDVSPRLAYLSTLAVKVGAGSIKQLTARPSTDADLTLPAPGADGSLSASAALVINTDAPRVTQVRAVTRDGVYRAGDAIYFEVIFNLPVVIFSVASLLTNIGSAGNDRYAVYSGGNGTTSLRFKLDCLESDQVAVLDYKDSLSLRPAYGTKIGWIRRKSTKPILPALLDLPITGLISKGISIDQACERVTEVFTSHVEGTYGVGESIDILVTYSASVTVDVTGGTPTISLTTGNSAVYQYLQGTKTLVFNYVVGQFDHTGQLEYLDRFSLNTNGALIRSLATSTLLSTLLPIPELSQLTNRDAVFVYTMSPVVLGVSTRSPDGMITVGDSIFVSVRFDFPVIVLPLSMGAGIPALYLNAGTGSGVVSSFVAAEENVIFFSFIVAAGQSTRKLAYFGRSALKCTGGYGLNKDPGQSAGPPTAVFLGDTFVTSWAEISSVSNTRHIRVKMFNMEHFPHFSSFEDGDGGLSTVNFATATDASDPHLVIYSSNLYLIWVETSTATNAPTQIRVAILSSRSSSALAAQWTFVDAYPATNFGINKDSTANAARPHAVVHHTKLYVAWHEDSGVAQIRVAVFNGLNSAPEWAFIDGNHNVHGLNYDVTQSAQNVRLCSCASKGSTLNVLYAVWSEMATSTGSAQIRVAFQSGRDGFSTWTFIDGNASTGLNIDTQQNANFPSIQCLGNSNVVVGWQESSGTGGSLLFVMIFNGNFSMPQWTRLDGGKYLNFNQFQPAQNLQLSVQTHLGTKALFATWQELDVTGATTQIRVAKLRAGAIPSWTFMDGGTKDSVLNDDTSHAASHPVLSSTQSQDRIVALWTEIHSSGQIHVRSSVLNGAVREWQPITQDCILHKSSTSTTSANLLLPALNTPGSLDFHHSIQVETSQPTIEKVSLAGDIYPVITQVNSIQTIDIFNIESIIQGEYKLIYGSRESSCIDWNAPATGLRSIKSALQTINGLSLQVSVLQDLTAFNSGYRYTVTFLFPSMGLLPLKVKTNSDPECKPFLCTPTFSRYPCNTNLIQINHNVDIRTGAGIVDAVVHFSFPVIVSTGSTKLSLDVGATMGDATYTSRNALQEFDVGLGMSSPALSGGFRLSYGDFSSGVGVGPIYTTECIQLFSMHEEDGIHEMRSKLTRIAAINTIGIHSLSRRKLQNGYRYIIEFRNSGDLLDLVPADSSSCPAVAAATQTIDITATSDLITGEVKIQFGEAESECIPWNIRANDHPNSMEAIIKYIDRDRIIAVKVEKDPSVYVHGVRYYVSFTHQSDAQQPLVAFTDAGCAAFTCRQANGVAGPCTGLSVSSNADFKVTRAASEAVSFRYIIQSTDEALFLTYKSTAALTGMFVRSSMNPTLAASLTLPTPPPAVVARDGISTLALVKSGDIPVVTRVYSTTNDDTYTAGDVILILIEFSGTVVVENTPVLELNSNGEAVYTSGSGSNVLHFFYKIQIGESSTALNYASKFSLQTFAATTFKIKCAHCISTCISAETTLPAISSAASLAGSSNLVVDTTVPIISLITSSRSDTAIGDVGYGPGEIVDIIVTFSTDVAVIGTPSIDLNSGGTATFTFGGYRQVLDVGVNSIVPITSGQFQIVYNGEVSDCIDFNDADSAAATSFKSRLLELKAVARIGLVSVTKTMKKNGNRFVIVFDSTKVVDVPFAIDIAFSNTCEPLQPSSISQEALDTRSTDNKILFHYTVGVGETAAILNVVGTSISLHAGMASILRQASSPNLAANINLPTSTAPETLAQTKTLRIDGTPASISDIVCDSAPGTYGVGFPTVASPLTIAPGEILFHFVFTRPVVVIGAPTVELATGSFLPSGSFIPNRFARFINQPQPNQVAFLYHIESGDSSLNLAFASLNVLSGATIYCASSTLSIRASLELPKLTVSNSVVLIDAFSVPATVKLASSHEDGVYGAGELIEIQVTLSKPVILLSGLNRNQNWHARYPVALEYESFIYIMWTEHDAVHNPAKSALYLRVFSSETLQEVPTASVAAINRDINTLVGKAVMTVWKNKLYAAWDEDGLLYCAQFEGLLSTSPWTLMPNMGINKNILMTASNPVLIVYNLELVVVWREMTPSDTSGDLIGQIRVAVLNDDTDAPLWIFHDRNELYSGLNRNVSMDADDPNAVVYRGRMYVSWTEMTAHGAYEIVIAQRNIQTRDYSFWTYLNAFPSAYPVDTVLSAYNPQFAVRRKGHEDLALLISWYRDSTTSNISEIITDQIFDVDWKDFDTGTILQPKGDKSLFSPSIKQSFVTCGDNIYASWLESHDVDASFDVKMATLSPEAHLYTGWIQVANQSSFNHDPTRDAIDATLVCSTSLTRKSQAGLLWTEYDGHSIKLRFRHDALVPRTPASVSNGSFGETIAGVPILLLETHSTPLGYATSTDTSGLTTTTLHFTYIVQQEESSLHLEVKGHDALQLNGAVIRDIFGNDPDLSLSPNSASARSLSHNSNLIINTTPPTVLHVTAQNPSEEYGIGQVLQIQVTFSYPVVVIEGDVANPPTILLHTDELHGISSSQGVATYTSGSGSAVLIFEYTTHQDDYCETLDYMNIASLVLNGRSWAIKRNATRPETDADLSLPPVKSPNSLSGTRTIAIKTTRPRVLQLNFLTPDGTYYPGDTVSIEILFSLPVVVLESPVLLLETGGESPMQATFESGNGTSTLTFVYTVYVGDVSSRLDVVDDRAEDTQAHFVQSLLLPGSSEIKRLSTSPVTSALTVIPAPGTPGSLSASRTIKIDSSPPIVIDIQSSVVDGTYDVGHPIDLLLVFSRSVVVTGIPEVLLNVLSEYGRTARYVDGSGTNTLRFTYIPQKGDNSGHHALDIRDEDSLLLRPLRSGKELLETPAQILCRSLNPILSAELKLPIPAATVRADAVRSLVGNNRKIFVRTDGYRVTACQSNTPNGIFSPGHKIVLSVIFTGLVVVQGTPRLKLNTNTAAYAVYIGGSGTSTPQFEYIIALGDQSTKLEVASQNALELNGGAITDTDGVNIPLFLTPPTLAGSLSFSAQLEISSAPPIIKQVYCTNSNYGVGDVLYISIVFSRKVAVINSSLVGSPTLLLQFDTGTRAAMYTSGDRTDTLVFNYLIANGDSSNQLDYAGTNALTGDILALSTTPILPANSDLPIPGSEGSLAHSCRIQVISASPFVKNVQALSRDGMYALSDTISLQVRFSFPVVVSMTQSCTLELALGGVELRAAVYVGGSTTTDLEFKYAIQPEDLSARLDYIGANSLQCTIFQSTSNPSLMASPTLPLSGAVHSLSVNSELQINALAPRILSVSSITANGVYGAGQIIDITITFSEAVVVPGDDELRLQLAIAMNVPFDQPYIEPYAYYVSGSGTNVLNFAYTTRVGDMALPLEYAGIDALSLLSQIDHIRAAGDPIHARRASMRLPVPGSTGSLSNNCDIHIDTLEPPRVVSVESPMADGVYTAGDIVTISIKFSTPVTVSGPTPTLLLDISNIYTSGTDKKALYVSGSGTEVLLFEYTIQVGDHADRLDYKSCFQANQNTQRRSKWNKWIRCFGAANALQLGGVGSSLKRTSSHPITDAVLDLPAPLCTACDVTQVTQATDYIEINYNQMSARKNEVSLLHRRAAFNIYSSGFPNHDTTLTEKIQEHNNFIELQRYPIRKPQALSVPQEPDAFSGIFLNGILFKSDTKSVENIDDCGGAVDAYGRYFYISVPTCLPATPSKDSGTFTNPEMKSESFIIAYALDGYPVYGYYDEKGELPTDLDECHGRIRPDGQYIYHLVPPQLSASPYMPCLKGFDDASQFAVFRYPANVSEIEDLSVFELANFNTFVIEQNSATHDVEPWLYSGVEVTFTSRSVIVRSTGIPPARSSYGPFPNAYNRYSVCEQNHVFQFPRNPDIASTMTSLPKDTPIGVMVNGIPFYAATSEVYGGIVIDSKNRAYKLLDKCNGLVDAGGEYRYYASPDCLLHELGDEAGKPSPLIGFALDGFPLYGPYNEEGQIPDDLDACNGRIGEDGTYQYHVTFQMPYLLGCFRGTPVIDQITLDAASGLYRSLSYSHALKINTDRPHVAHVFTNKRPGSYVAGESIDVVVEWTTPIQVTTTGGIPSLAIQNSSALAIYDAARSCAAQTVFLYVIKSDDVYLEDFSYDVRAAIQLNGGRITRLARFPMLDAVLDLLPSDLMDIELIRTKSSGLTSKFQLIRDLRVELRGLYHPRAHDLRTRVFHGNRQSTIFDACCKSRDAFGVPDVFINRQQSASEARISTKGVGWDYSFSDLRGMKNMALDGSATASQSSISGSCGPANAIDGIKRVGSAAQTVARTLPGNEKTGASWWEMRFVDPVIIGTVRIWVDQGENSLPAMVLVLQVDSSDGTSAVTGDFSLIFSTSESKELETGRINHNAVAMIVDENARVTTSGVGHGESIQAKLLALGNAMPRLFITREPRDTVQSRNGAFTWHITFLDDPRPNSAVLAPGVNNICGGSGIVRLAAPLPIDDVSDPIIYRDDKSSMSSTGTLNDSMFPFWVFLFNGRTELNTIETFVDAVSRATYSYRVAENHANRSVISIVVPFGIKAQYVRLMTELPEGILSIVEVEVFSEQSHILSKYRGGTPVRTAYHPGGITWSPEEEFRSIFGGMPSEGAWTLAIKDMANNDSLTPNTSEGGISDWVLHITNQADETFTYFMDFEAKIHALPRHGTLFVGLDETERDQLDTDNNGVLDSIEADRHLRTYSPNNYLDLPSDIRHRELKEFLKSFEKFKAIPIPRDPSERQLRIPSSVCNSECLASSRLDPYFHTGLEGDKASKLLRVVGNRVVKYVPDNEFRGLDAFTFSVAVAGHDSRIPGIVQLIVKECEDPECRIASFQLQRNS